MSLWSRIFENEIFYYFCDQYGGFGGGGFSGGGGGGGYTGGIGASDFHIAGGGGGSFSADPNATRELDWYDEGNCTIEYISQ